MKIWKHKKHSDGEGKKAGKEEKGRKREEEREDPKQKSWLRLYS